MLKKAILSVLAVACMLSAAGCACEHVWKDATCTTPKTCESCGETEGEPIAHNFAAATCTEPKTCKDCGLTEGEPAAHDFADATCTDPKTCKDCGATEGSLGDHIWIDATYSVPKTCETCGKTEGEALVRTDFSRDAVFDSPASDNAIKYIKSITPEGTAPTYSYAEDERLWTFYLLAPEGLADTYRNDPEAWETMKTTLIDACPEIQKIFAEDGFPLTARIQMIDSQGEIDWDKKILEIDNGEVKFDGLSGDGTSASSNSPGDPFLTSEACSYVRQIVGTSSYANLSPSYSYKDRVFYVELHAPTGFAAALANAPAEVVDAWNSTTQNLVEFSTLATALFAEEGHDAICAVLFMSDADPEETLFACAAGQVLVDIMAE